MARRVKLRNFSSVNKLGFLVINETSNLADIKQGNTKSKNVQTPVGET